MVFPNDLSNVAVFKIHPAMGVARLANNDDYYEFFDYEEKRKTGNPQDLKYMSKRDGNHWMMRQAVRFRVFAYSQDGSELGELTETVMADLGVTATWTASVANRKLHHWSGNVTPVVEAEETVTAGEVKRLFGVNPWDSEKKVWLGDVTGEGMFIPPKGGAYRKTATSDIRPYGEHEMDNDVLDTTSDGSINVELTGTGDLPVVPACVIVAPQDHSPDVFARDLGGNNKDFVEATRVLLGIPTNVTLTGQGYSMDIAMMDTVNGDYNPGMELALEPGNARPIPEPEKAFYPRGQEHIAEYEIRPIYGDGGVEHGALTAGLCSTWQTDLNACLNWWTAEYPQRVMHEDPPIRRFLSRKDFDTELPWEKEPEFLNAYIDMMGVGRNVKGNPRFVHETERDANDNAGATPTPPFPTEPDDAGTGS